MDPVSDEWFDNASEEYGRMRESEEVMTRLIERAINNCVPGVHDNISALLRLCLRGDRECKTVVNALPAEEWPQVPKDVPF